MPQPVGAHIWGVDPLREASEVGADCIQLFLSDPQGWEKPPPRDDVGELRASDVGLYVYLINVCSPRPNVRYGSRKILNKTCEAAADVGALAVIVHPGHSEDGLDEGVESWVRTLERMKAGLNECIGCGCLSLDRCRLANPGDRAARRGAGPRYWVQP